MRDTEKPDAGILNACAAGYTYLGQFIDHDLTWDPSPISEAPSAPERTRNLRNAKLDLEILYGGGPTVSPYLYASSSRRSAEHLLLGMTVRKAGHEPSADDLPRNHEGLTIVPDLRQDDNVIIAQLHVAFAKLHNKIINDRGELAKSPHYAAAGSTFAAARRLLTWHYQWLVRHDFARQLLDPEVVEALDDVQGRTTDASAGTFSIPVEFSLAAFRFGHSMVRDEYLYNATHGVVKLREQLALNTGPGGGAVPNLGADWKIEWSNFFFDGDDTRANRIRKIDTRVARGLFDLPPSGFHLPVVTLTRGARIGLPSGQTIARHLGAEPVPPDALALDMDASLCAEHRFDLQTPLWYYILKEAEVCASAKHLGPVGSRIVADVILGALRSDASPISQLRPTGSRRYRRREGRNASKWPIFSVTCGRRLNPARLDSSTSDNLHRDTSGCRPFRAGEERKCGSSRYLVLAPTRWRARMRSVRPPSVRRRG
jgi:hypothetical protein